MTIDRYSATALIVNCKNIFSKILNFLNNMGYEIVLSSGQPFLHLI